MNKMLALSWKQPFASLMLHGKQETRIWPTNVRCEILMCTTKVPYRAHVVERISGERQFKRIIETLTDDDTTTMYGKAVAVGSLVDCRKMTKADEDLCFVEYQSGLWVHVYENVRKIVPFDWQGKQGFKEVPEDIKAQIQFL